MTDLAADATRDAVGRAVIDAIEGGGDLCQRLTVEILRLFYMSEASSETSATRYVLTHRRAYMIMITTNLPKW